ncbi:phosphohydrolase, partial [Halobacteriales archaeon QH_8_68_33]
YETGRRGINTVSSQAIESVELKPGDGKPVMVEISMRNAAGVYQVDELLQAKLQGSGLEGYVRIVALNVEGATDTIVERMEL